MAERRLASKGARALAEEDAAEIVRPTDVADSGNALELGSRARETASRRR
jgi:hypothetical protein